MTENTKMIIETICQPVLIALLGVVSGLIVKYIKQWTNSAVNKTDADVLDKYIIMASDLIADCVEATNQIFTDSLKQSGCFTEEAQKEAFAMTKEAFLKSLGEAEKKFLSATLSDFDAWVNTKIEAKVAQCKKGCVITETTETHINIKPEVSE